MCIQDIHYIYSSKPGGVSSKSGAICILPFKIPNLRFGMTKGFKRKHVYEKCMKKEGVNGL